MSFKNIKDSSVIKKRLIEINKIAEELTPKKQRVDTEFSVSQTWDVIRERKDGDLIKAKFVLHTYGQNLNQFERLSWSRGYMTNQLVQGISREFENNNIYSVLILTRTLLELTANYIDTITKVNELLEKYGLNQHRKVSLAYNKMVVDRLVVDRVLEGYDELKDVVQKATLATSINVEDYWTSERILGEKRKDYKQAEDTIDLKPKTILYAIDSLDKKIKGTRRCYDFLCQFSHPNFGPYMLSHQDKSVINTYDNNLIVVRTVMAPNNEDHLDEGTTKLVEETFELMLLAMNEFKVSSMGIYKEFRNIRKVLKIIAKFTMQNNPELFARDELCPCGSGDNITACCGRKMKAAFKTYH